jgi:hypothetical protein
MNLKKAGRQCVVWGPFCAVAISPVILIWGVPLGIGIVSDLVRIGYGSIVASFALVALLRAFSYCRANWPWSRRDGPIGPEKMTCGRGGRRSSHA